MKARVNQCGLWLYVHARQFFANRSGVSALEYSLIIIAVLAVVGVGITTLTVEFKDIFGQAKTTMEATLNNAKDPN